MRTAIKKYEFKSGLPFEFEIVSLNELYKTHKYMLTNPHRTGFYHILWFQKGRPTHLVDFKPVTVKPGTFLFLNKDTVQRFDTNEDFEGEAILFTESFFCQTDADVKYLRSTILFNDLFEVSQIQSEVSVFVDLINQIKVELANPKDSLQAGILQNLLHNFLLQSERERRKQDFVEIKKGPDLDYVMLFKDVLEANYRTQKQVSAYAEQMAVTEKRLNQATSKILGKSPKEMIDERIMLEAKRLLSHTGENVKEIGFELGFEEPTNFIKYFRKHNDSTPIEFREKYRTA